MDYRYILKPFGVGERKKLLCPCCGQRTFVPYIDTSTGQIIDETVGRCDRQNNCSYHRTPSEWFREHPKDSPHARNFTPLPEYVKHPDRPASLISNADVAQTLGGLNNNLLFRWLCREFGEQEVTKVARYYHLGTVSWPWSGATVFWQYDRNKCVRTGKVMLYNPDNGHRVKEPQSRILFFHRLKSPYKEDFNLVQCLFGEHLVPLAKGPICVVESEKTALIASICLKGYTWLATGGLNNLKAESCKCLDGKDVIFFPDLAGEDKWAEKLAEITNLRHCEMSTWLRERSSKEEINRGLDIGDYIVTHKNNLQSLKNHIKQITGRFATQTTVNRQRPSGFGDGIDEDFV